MTPEQANEPVPKTMAELAKQVAIAAPKWRLAPINPEYIREWSTSVVGGSAKLSIPAPGGYISTEDAAYMSEWLGLVIKQLDRIAKRDLK